MYYQL